jgi:hypothetical protein
LLRFLVFFERIVALVVGTIAYGFVAVSACVPAERFATFGTAVTIKLVIDMDVSATIHARFI